MNTNVQREPRSENERPTREIYLSPEVNIFESQDGYVLEAEMPGVSKEGLHITLEGTEMTLVGERKAASLPGEPLFRESRDLNFRRVFELDPAIDTSKISAEVEQGLLTLTLPKSESVKPRKITVN